MTASSSSSSYSSVLLASATVVASSALLYLYTRTIQKAENRYRSSQWHDQEEEQFGHETLHSIIEHFKDFSLSKTSSVKEANQRRTLSYYLKARQAHEQSLVLGQPNYSKLLQARQEEEKQILHYYNQGTKSHRTVIVMLDRMSAHILHEARRHILAPLQYSHDPTTRGVWIPERNMIPPCDMHVTVAIPWWWHTISGDAHENQELSQAIANRFRQALVLDFHHPFQLELERIILLGGKTLVALWRTIGERLVVEDHHVISDRHGTDIDPMVRLRREIVHCFTTENEDIQRKPLTYHAHKQSLLAAQTELEQDAFLQQVFDGAEPVGVDGPTTPTTPIVTSSSIGANSISTNTTAGSTNSGSGSVSGSADDTAVTSRRPRLPNPLALKRHNSTPKSSSGAPPPPPVPKPRPKLERQPTIEFKTPGMGDGDGFIHTTLCRLPLDCLSMTDVELEPIHRLCREATAMYAGHRMIVHQFRFLETTGKGGDSNPCVDPIFDETMEAPTRVMVDATGHVTRVGTHHAPHHASVYYSSNSIGSGGSNHAVGGGTNSRMDSDTTGGDGFNGGTAGGPWSSNGGSGISHYHHTNGGIGGNHLHHPLLGRAESRNTIGALAGSGFAMTQNPPMHSLFDAPVERD